MAMKIILTIALPFVVVIACGRQIFWGIGDIIHCCQHEVKANCDSWLKHMRKKS